MRMEEDYAKNDLAIANMLLQYRKRRRRRRRPRIFWIRPWIQRRKDFGHYDRLMHELETEDRESFTNFLRVPPEMFQGLEERLTRRLTKQDTWLIHLLWYLSLRLLLPAASGCCLLRRLDSITKCTRVSKLLRRYSSHRSG